jgi:putative peptidoglycan lipid II flippase
MAEASDNSKPKSWRDRILRAAMLVGIAHLLVKFVGVLQNRFLGDYFDASERDFFIAIYKGIFLTIFFIGEETLGPIFLPAFMKIKEERGEGPAWRFGSVIFNCYFVILAGIGAIIALCPLWVVRLMTKWSEDPAHKDFALHAQFFELSERFLPLLIPGLIAMCLGSLTYLLLNAREKFFWAAWGDGMVKVLILLGVIVAGRYFMVQTDEATLAGPTLKIAIIGLSLGGIAKLLCHFTALGRDLRNYRPVLRGDRKEMRAFLLLLLPLLLSIVFAKVRDIFNHIWILSDHEGLISANAFGKTIADSINYLVPYAVAIALLPYFCMLMEKQDDGKFAEILRNATRSMLFLFVPISIIFIVVAFPLTRGFYETGKFTEGDAVLTAIANACYVAGLAFSALEAVFMQAFFSRRSIWPPVLIGMFCSSLSMAISYLGFNMLGLPQHLLVAVVPTGFVISRLIKVCLLWFLLHRRIAFFDRPAAMATVKAVLVSGGVALVAAAGLYWAVDLLLAQEATAAMFAKLPKMIAYLGMSGVIAGGAGLSFFFVACRAGLDEPRWLYEWSLEKYPKLARLPVESLLFGKAR